MYSHGFIKTKWDETGPNDGLGEMFDAIKYYKNNNELSMDIIKKYNEVDCKVLWEIVKYLRENNCDNIKEYKSS